MQETWVQSLDWEDPLEKGTATQSYILLLLLGFWLYREVRSSSPPPLAQSLVLIPPCSPEKIPGLDVHQSLGSLWLQGTQPVPYLEEAEGEGNDRG